MYLPFNHKDKKGQKKNSIYLLSPSCKFDVLKSMPLQFTITTKNSSGKFNTIILKDTSEVISGFLSNNPNSSEYHLDIEDSENVLGKLEQVYRGNFIKFTQKDISIYQKIKNDLQIDNLPDLMFNNHNNNNFHGWGALYNRRMPNTFNIDASNKEVHINFSSFSYYIENVNPTFTIQTKKREYLCSIFAATSSKTIRDYLSTNPQSDRYFYDIDDADEEFNYINDIFNFKAVTLTSRNSDSIKNIAEDLGIGCILNTVNSFFDDKDKVSQIIDDQEDIIDSIDEIFDLIYHIDELTVDSVASSIKKSKWSKTEKDIYELAAFIIQAANANIRLHTYLVDLLLKLDTKEPNDKPNKLNLLLPFISSKLADISSLQNNNIFPFIYHMYKKSLVFKEKINPFLKYNYSNNDYFIAWFLPELIEMNEDEERVNLFKRMALRDQITIRRDHHIIPKVNDIDEYIKIRDKGESNDEIAKAIRNDDINTFQSTISKDLDRQMKNLIIPNMFEPFIQNSLRYINYAAAYGSINCFKYMILNHEEIDQNTLEMAIIGGNKELIRIVDNQKLDLNQNRPIANNMFFHRIGGPPRPRRPIENCLTNAISRAIIMHRDDVFDWIFEQKFDSLDQKYDFETLIRSSIENGNAHSLVQLIESGFNSSDDQHYFDIASERGFYSLLTILDKFFQRQNKNKKFQVNERASVSFGNIYIFKFFEDQFNTDQLEGALSYAIKSGFIDIVEYFFDTIVDKKLVLNSQNASIFIKCSLYNNSQEMVDYLIDKFNYYKLFTTTFFNILIKSFRELDRKSAKKIMELIKKIAKITYNTDPKSNFTEVSFNCYQQDLDEMITFFIDNKYYVDYIDLAQSIISTIRPNDNINLPIFSLIIDQVDSENRKRIIDSIDKINTVKSKQLIEYLVKENAYIEYSLFQAVETNQIELVKKILTIPGINPSISNKFDTPLSKSVLCNSPTIFNLIFDFYKDDIKNQKWQLEQAVKKIIRTNTVNDSYNEHEKYCKNLGYTRKIETISQKKADTNEYSQKIDQCSMLSRIIKLNIIDPNFSTIDNTLLNFLCKYNSLENVTELLKNEKTDVNLRNPQTGETPLITFIKYNIDDENSIANLLIKHPQIDLNIRDYSNDSALLLAIQTNKKKIVKLIIESDKLDLNSDDINIGFLITNNQIAKILIKHKKFNPHYTLNSNRFPNKPTTPMLRALNDNDTELLFSIIHHPLFQRDNSQILDTIHNSILKSDINIFNLLIKEFNIDINSPIYDECNPLLDAINHHVNKIMVSNILNNPAFDSKKCSIDKAFYNLTNIENATNSFNFVSKYSSEMMDILYRFDQEHDHLIDIRKDNLLKKIYNVFYNEIDPNQKTKNKTYPLEEAIIEKSYIRSLCLINSGDVDFKVDLVSNTFHSQKFSNLISKYKYFHLAAKLGQTEIIKEFLNQHSYDINVTDSLGETALMKACRNKQFDCVKFLFKYDDLDYHHKNNEGKDAIQIAKNKENGDDKNKEEYLSDLLELMKNITKNSFMLPNDNSDHKSREYYLYHSYISKPSKFNGFKPTFSTKSLNPPPIDSPFNNILKNKSLNMNNNLKMSFGNNNYNNYTITGRDYRKNKKLNFSTLPIKLNSYTENPESDKTKTIDSNKDSSFSFTNKNNSSSTQQKNNEDAPASNLEIKNEDAQKTKVIKDASAFAFAHKKDANSDQQKTNGFASTTNSFGTKKFGSSQKTATVPKDVSAFAFAHKKAVNLDQQENKDTISTANKFGAKKFGLSQKTATPKDASAFAFAHKKAANSDQQETNGFASTTSNFGTKKFGSSQKTATVPKDASAFAFAHKKAVKLDQQENKDTISTTNKFGAKNEATATTVTRNLAPKTKKYTIHNESFDVESDPKSQQQKPQPKCIRNVTRSLIEDDFDEEEITYRPFYQPPNQEQLMMLQQQQQQWFRMIQMNNQYQAQFNMQMMNNQARLQHSSSKKKKKSKK